MSNNRVEIIGFDLGHGETALTKIFGGDTQPKQLLLHQQSCQPTMIAYHPEGGVLFGKPALNQKATDFQIPFKKHPTSDPNYQKVMRDYVNAIYDHLLETNQLQKDDQNHFFISCPSEWTDAEVAEYQKLLESSNLPRVTVIKESYAALMQAVKSELLTTEDIKGNVLVIDVGSFTIDLTVVKKQTSQQSSSSITPELKLRLGFDIDNFINRDSHSISIDWGASLIDKAILDYSLSQNEDREAIENAFKKTPIWRELCEFKCRQAKEEYFSNPHCYEDEDCGAGFGLLKIRDVGIFEPIVYKSIMEKILNQPLPELGNQSLIDSFHNFLFNMNEELEKQEIKLSPILLTGGASKMDFIPEIIHQVFPNYRCIKDTEPGLCIAMGLARLGMQYSLIEKYNIPQNDKSQKNKDIKKVTEVTMNNKKLEIIGFDLGHGETALTKILGNDPNSAPVKLLLHKKDCQPTMIAYHPEQGVLFGKPALDLKATDFQIAFKKRPTSDSNYQKVMKDYVKAIYQHLLQTDQLQKDDQNHFFIGCPSEWSDPEQAEYQKLLASSNLPKVSVIEESYAALMQAVKSELLTTEDIKGNVLVLDVGSSTTDCTLVKAGIHDEKDDFGIDLGAGLIDKAILHYSLSQNEDREAIENAFKKIPLIRERCEFSCREAKEEYFCYSLQYTDEDSLVPTKTYKIRGIGNFDPIIYKEIIERIISQSLENCLPNYKEILPSLPTVKFQKSWQDNFYNFLMNTKQELEEKGVKVNTILLTGGASKMDFIPEIVHKIFPNCKCTKDTEPSFCIAMGLARWGKKSINSIHFLEEVEQFLQKDLPKIFTDKVASLRSKLTENLVEGLSYKVIKPALLDWRNRSGIYTINNLESVIISRVKTWLEGMGGQEVIKKAISNWVNDDLVPSMKEKTDIICKKYGLGLDQLVPYSLTYNPTADKLTSETLNLADPTVMTPIINWIIGIVVTVITLFLATTVIGLIIGLFVIFGLQGWAEETIKDWDIPKKPRGWVNNDKISEMTSEIKGKLTGGVEKAIAEDIKFIDKILNQVKDGLSKEVRKQADSVKILIS